MTVGQLFTNPAIDKSGDGRLGIDEVKPLFALAGLHMPPAPRAVIAFLDTSGDGEFDVAEVDAALRKAARAGSPCRSTARRASRARSRARGAAAAAAGGARPGPLLPAALRVRVAKKREAKAKRLLLPRMIQRRHRGATPLASPGARVAARLRWPGCDPRRRPRRAANCAARLLL